MGFNSVGDMVKYFADVDRRVSDGTLNPTIANYGDEVARLSASLETVQDMLAQGIIQKNQDDSTMLYLADAAHMMALLLGKMSGFSFGVTFLLGRAGNQGEYLV